MEDNIEIVRLNEALLRTEFERDYLRILVDRLLPVSDEYIKNAFDEIATLRKRVVELENKEKK